jgi:hypothetical protein
MFFSMGCHCTPVTSMVWPWEMEMEEDIGFSSEYIEIGITEV